MTTWLLINTFLSGAIALGMMMIGVSFHRFWRRTQISLFRYFSTAFFVLAVERVVLVLVNPANEFGPYLYVLRLFAFILIIAGIVAQNRTLER